jgi:endonuclease YncB( thermonuclease family)
MRRARRWQRPTRPAVQRPRSASSWIVLAVAALAAWAYSEWTKTPPASGRIDGEAIAGAVRVVDGDSLEIGEARIRLFGIDAPELRQLCRDAKGSDVTCGLAARDALTRLIGGRDVSCAPAEAPSYDRIVAICTVGGQDLSEAMARDGHAIELKAHSKGRYAAVERAARDARRGIWTGAFERPSEWRQRTTR